VLPGDRRVKDDTTIKLDLDDKIWAQAHGINLSEIFGNFLKLIRMETEVVSYDLLIRRAVRHDRKQSSTGV
jgi:hypothetical protein